MSRSSAAGKFTAAPVTKVMSYKHYPWAVAARVTMNQQDLVDAAAATGASKTGAAKAVAAVLDAIRDGLQRGEKVALSGFASSRRPSVGRGRAATSARARRSTCRP